MTRKEWRSFEEIRAEAIASGKVTAEQMDAAQEEIKAQQYAALEETADLGDEEDLDTVLERLRVIRRVLAERRRNAKV